MQGFLGRSRRGMEAVVREAEAAGVDRGPWWPTGAPGWR